MHKREGRSVRFWRLFFWTYREFDGSLQQTREVNSVGEIGPRWSSGVKEMEIH